MNDRFIINPREDTIDEVVEWFGFLHNDPIELDECDVDILVRDAKNVMLLTATDCGNGEVGSVIKSLKDKVVKLTPNFDFLKGSKYMALFCYDPAYPCPWNGRNLMSELLRILPDDADIMWGMSPQTSNGQFSIKIAVTNLKIQN